MRRGQARSLDRSLAEALAESAASGPSPSAAPGTGDGDARSDVALGARERAVAALVARGLTNRHVAQALGIAERSVGKHVALIFDKLGFTARAQVAAWAVGRGLHAPPPDGR